MSKKIKSFEDIKQFSIIILLYRTGSSGEFIATALSKTLNNFAQAIFYKKSEERWDFQDAFWKSLNGGWSNIDPDDVISRFRLYLNDKSNVTETTHIALAHPLGASLKFINQYLYECPIIEIITKNKLSLAAKKRFKDGPESHPMFGKHHTEESKKQISKNKKGNIPWNKKI
jgi:hypothetical protein